MQTILTPLTWHLSFAWHIGVWRSNIKSRTYSVNLCFISFRLISTQCIIFVLCLIPAIDFSATHTLYQSSSHVRTGSEAGSLCNSLRTQACVKIGLVMISRHTSCKSYILSVSDQITCESDIEDPDLTKTWELFVFVPDSFLFSIKVPNTDH